MDDDLLKHLREVDDSLYVSLITQPRLKKVSNYTVFQWIFLGLTLCFFLFTIVKSDIDYQERAILIASYSVVISIFSLIYQNIVKKSSIETDDIDQIKYYLYVSNILQIYCSNSIGEDQKEELYQLIKKIHYMKFLSLNYKEDDFDWVKTEQEFNNIIESYKAKIQEKKSSTSQLEDTK
jgi:hypothetical protein